MANNQKSFYLIEPVNNEMKVRAEQNLLKHGHIQTPNINIISISVNDNYRKLLVNCSDKILRLYQVHYPRPKQKGVKLAFELLDSFTDPINHNRWINA